MTAYGLVLLIFHIGPDPLPPDNHDRQTVNPIPGGGGPQGEVNPPNPNDVGGSGNENGGQARQLTQYESQLAKLNASVEACELQLQQFQQQQRQALMNSDGLSNGNAMEPACFQNMYQQAIQVGILVTRISRLKTGNMNLTFCQANNNPRGCESVQILPGSGSSSGSSGGSGDDPYATVEQSTRQGIRGNTMYTDGQGQQHELPTAPYYFRDTQTGEFVSSDSPNPPNNTHTYELMTAEN